MAMRAGKALRDGWALDRAAAQSCGGCGHPMGEHGERGYEVTVDLETLTAVEAPRAGHEPGLFFCRHDGCGCSVRA